MGTATLEAPAVDAPAVRRRRKQVRRSQRVAVRTARAGGVSDLPRLPGALVTVVQLHRLGWAQPDLQRCRAGELHQHAEGPGGHPGGDQQHHLDRRDDLLPGRHRAGLSHAVERQGAWEACSAAALLYALRTAAGCDRLDLGLALQPAIRRDQLVPAADRTRQFGPAMAWAGLDRACRGHGARRSGFASASRCCCT